MDFGKLSSNEKLAVYGSAATLIGGIVGGTVSALGWLAFVAAIAMLAIVFLPQLSPSTSLPGSKGSLMLICGAVAGIIMVLALLTILGLLGTYFAVLPLNAIFFLIAVVGAVVMAWAGWQEFQSEGGKFQVGTASGTSASPPATDTSAPPPPPAAAPPPATAPPPAAAPPSPPDASEPMSNDPASEARDDEGRPTI
jgi:hypothetical protein